MLVAPRICVLRAVPEQMRLDRVGCIRQAVLRDVEADDVGARQQLLELMQQESLPAAHVENARPVPQTVDLDHLLGDDLPSPVVPVAAVAEAAIAVPIIEFVLLRLQHAHDFVVHHARQVVALRPPVQRCDDVQQLPHSRSLRTLLAESTQQSLVLLC